MSLSHTCRRRKGAGGAVKVHGNCKERGPRALQVRMIDDGKSMKRSRLTTLSIQEGGAAGASTSDRRCNRATKGSHEHLKHDGKNCIKFQPPPTTQNPPSPSTHTVQSCFRPPAMHNPSSFTYLPEIVLMVGCFELKRTMCVLSISNTLTS